MDVRTELNIPIDGKIVIGCGYGDMRKGIDYFIQLANHTIKENRNVYFVWIGDLAEELSSFLNKDIAQLPETHFIVTGFRNDTGRLMCGADLFALTSREDPFPSVIMEAMDAGLPVFGFEGSGGYGSIVNQNSGGLIPFGDVARYSASILQLLSNPCEHSVVSTYNSAYSKSHFGYSKYMQNLLDLLTTGEVVDGDVVKHTVTAVIPNYNYSRYLKLRLKTVFAQSRQPDEIIILDDGSTDNSIEVIREFVKGKTIPVKVIENDKNSGNVFVQWKKGLEEANGDLVWIAEADDYCDQDFLENMCRGFSDESVVISSCNSVMVDGFGSSYGVSYEDYLQELFGDYFTHGFKADGAEFVNDVLVIRNAIMNASAVVFKKNAAASAMQSLGELRISGDWLFWIEVCLQGKISYTNNCYNYHRRHSNSVLGKALRNKTEVISEMLTLADIISGAHSEVITKASIQKLLKSVESTYDELFSSDQNFVPIYDNPDLCIQYSKYLEEKPGGESLVVV